MVDVAMNIFFCNIILLFGFSKTRVCRMCTLLVDENNPIIGLRIFSYAIIHEIGTIMYMSKVSSRNVNSKVGSRNV